MKDNDLSRQFTENLSFYPTESQKKAIDELCSYLYDKDPYALFLLKGYAGTGKTFLIRSVASVLTGMGIKVVLMASTGRAARVLSGMVGMPAYTIHRTIYRSTAASVEEGGGFKLSSNNRTGTVYIVDEASMITTDGSEPGIFGSGNLLADLLAYIWNGEACKLLMIGDAAQLPPVGMELSPALDRQLLERDFGMKVYESELTDVVRQQFESGILHNATCLRSLIRQCMDKNEDKVSVKLSARTFSDIEAITGAELIDTLDKHYRQYGVEGCQVIAFSNKRSLVYNMGIRSQVLDYEEQLVRGERLVVARNNYTYAKRRDKSDFIANGDIVEVVRLHKYHEMYGLKFADATIRMEDNDNELEVRLLLDGLTSEEAQMNYHERMRFYWEVEQDYMHISSIPARRKAIRQDPFRSALEVKYAYAMTCHKAQGGQWPCVFVDMGFLSLVPEDLNLLRWLYTAITRATSRLILINTPPSMLAE